MKEDRLYELELFAGAGGGILGGQLLGWRCIGAVERDDYCRRVLLQRQSDGILPPFPIWDDMRTFTKRNNNVRPFIKALRRVAHRLVIKAGFPCQPFSVAGKRLGADDDRNGWPWTIRSIREIRPAYALLENVPGLLTSGYFDTILGDMAACGYDARWRVLSAAELGAPHQRDRLWIVAYPTNTGRQRQNGEREPDCERAGSASVGPEFLAESRLNGSAQYVADTAGAGCKTRSSDEMGDGKRTQRATYSSCKSESIPDAERSRLAQRQGLEAERSHAIVAGSDWWAVEPDILRVAHGVADRVHRLRAIGNGQVPAVVRAAWHLLRPEE